jgi:hypothetical protein
VITRASAIRVARAPGQAPPPNKDRPLRSQSVTRSDQLLVVYFRARHRATHGFMMRCKHAAQLDRRLHGLSRRHPRHGHRDLRGYKSELWDAAQRLLLRQIHRLVEVATDSASALARTKRAADDIVVASSSSRRHAWTSEVRREFLKQNAQE